MMRRNTLSLAIGLVLLASYVSAVNAEDLTGIENPPEGAPEYPPPGDGSAYPPPEEPLPPADGYPIPPEDEPLPPYEGEPTYPPYPEGEPQPTHEGEPKNPPYPEGEPLPPGSDEPTHSHDGHPPHPEGEPFPPPRLEDFGLHRDQFEFFGAGDIEKLDPEAFKAFGQDDFSHLPPEAMRGFKPEQFRELKRETFAGLNEQQFDEIPPELFAEINPEQVGGFKPELVGHFRPEHFEQFKPENFGEGDSKDIFRMLANSDPDHIKPEHVDHLLPKGWILLDNGEMEIPEGEHFILPPIAFKNDFLPEELPDLNKGMGIGGQGKPMIDGMEEALFHANLPQFDLKQDAKGILQVAGTEQFDGTDLAFIPDMKNMRQAGEGAKPGVRQNEHGFFVLTTPDLQELPIRPAPKDPEQIKKHIPGEGGAVKVGEEGDVFFNIPEQDGRPPRCDVGIFDPFLKPAPEGLEPGVHFPDDPTGLKPAVIVYEDGTSQTMNPTVPSPADFIEKAEEFDGVEDTHFNGDGTIGLMYQGRKIILKPTFNVKMEDLPEKTSEAPINIVVKEGGIVEYRFPQDGQIAIFTVNINFQ